MAAQQPARTSPELRARLHSARANVGITPRPGALPGEAPNIRDLHIIDAATRIVGALGINYDAWSKAVEFMGDHGAALCVLIIDANRNHPTTPVRNPGGALRAMTARHKAGKLNIVGSLIGLARRRG